jgi:hypothetical protein
MYNNIHVLSIYMFKVSTPIHFPLNLHDGDDGEVHLTATAGESQKGKVLVDNKWQTFAIMQISSENTC